MERARAKNEEEDEDEGYTDVFSRRRVAWPSTCTEYDERSAILKDSKWNGRKGKKGLSTNMIGNSRGIVSMRGGGSRDRRKSPVRRW